MSTILDALRKAAARRPASPASPTPTQEEPVASPASDAPLPEWPQAPTLERPAPARTVVSEPIAGPRASEPPAAAVPAGEPAASPREPEPPPPGDFPISEDPSFLPADDDGAANRRKLLRAGLVVAVGIVLGLFVGRRFLPESGTGADDLLSDAALSKPAAKATAPQVAKTTDNAPPKLAGEPVPTGPEKAGGDEGSVGGEKGRGGRSEKQRRDAEKKKDEPKASEEPAPAKPGLAPEPADASPPFAATPLPQQARPKSPTTPTTPAPGKPAPPASAPSPAGGGTAVAALPPATTLPPAPPAVVTPPPAAPVTLPPPPDDAPALSLLFIQWSNDPARRVASLRQSSGGAIYIVHEGDIVQGLRVAVIRPTGVEVQWRGQSFLLPASRH